MTAPAWIFLAAWAFTIVLLMIACVGDVNLAERLRAANKRNVDLTRFYERREISATWRAEGLLAECAAIAAEKDALAERLDVLEARGLPWWDEYHSARDVAKRAANLAERRSL